MSAGPAPRSRPRGGAAQVRGTYRLQLHGEFGFHAAAALGDYLAELGVSHVYTSPCQQALPGSRHGYDIVDHGRVNPELGGDAGRAAFVEALARHGLGHVLDIVPNHMAISSRDNAWWWDVLENGPASRFAPYFDVDWDPPEIRFRNMVLLPILGDQYGRVLEAGAIVLERDGGTFTIRHGPHVLPVDPWSLSALLGAAAADADSDSLAFMADALARLPSPTVTDHASAWRRRRDRDVLVAGLARLGAESPTIAAAIDRAVARTNEDPEALHGLLELQHYRLAWWHTAARDLGYRRFFDVNQLIGLRMEDERVFAATHGLITGWLDDGSLDGLRVDHVDGLRDPQVYLDRLRAAHPGAWIVVEKILAAGEHLRPSWPVAGTTGYDFMNRVTGLFVDPAGEKPLTDLYAAFTGEPTEYPAIVRQRKILILRDVLGSDLGRLVGLLLDICERHRRYRDHTRHELTDALREVFAAWPVYRTYVRPATGVAEPDDVAAIEQALRTVRTQRPDIDARLLDFLGDVLCLRVTGELEAEWVSRFQQVTGSVTAKAVEDSVFYAYNRLVALNEVGGDPGRFGVTLDAFHRETGSAGARSPAGPSGMVTTATHDTKRGEDVRARLVLLSEIPEEWTRAVWRWARMNERWRRGGMPERNMEYLLYQTLVGAWPLSTPRAVAYMEKAAREARARTTWTAPDVEYEAALRAFVEGVTGDAEFLTDLARFVAPLIEPGRITSLAQTLLKLTVPGVPDVYQGTELWSLDLVDPDNRRPVDYTLRRRLLAELRDDPRPERIWAAIESGAPKLWVIRQSLGLRCRHPAWFEAGSGYTPLAARGERAGHAVAFARGRDVVVVVPRCTVGLSGRWGDTRITIEERAWHNELTGETLAGGDVALGELLRRFPVALLVRESGRRPG